MMYGYALAQGAAKPLVTAAPPNGTGGTATA